jgi:hypothetical protein
MNIRNVLRVYIQLRQFSDDETALLETLRGLSEGDREQLVESLAPVKAAVKKRKPRAKSVRASGMEAQLSGNLQARRQEALEDITGESESADAVHVASGGD